MRFGEFVTEPTPWPFVSPLTMYAGTLAATPIYAVPSSLYSIALQWLTEDREYRRKLESGGWKTKGPRRDVVWGIYFDMPFHHLRHLCRPFLLTLRHSITSMNVLSFHALRLLIILIDMTTAINPPYKSVTEFNLRFHNRNFAANCTIHYINCVSKFRHYSSRSIKEAATNTNSFPTAPIF